MEALAKILNVTRQSISEWEKGKRKIPEERAKQLEQIFNVDKKWLSMEVENIDKINIQNEYIKNNPNEALRLKGTQLSKTDKVYSKMIDCLFDGVDTDGKNDVFDGITQRRIEFISATAKNDDIVADLLLDNILFSSYLDCFKAFTTVFEDILKEEKDNQNIEISKFRKHLRDYKK